MRQFFKASNYNFNLISLIKNTILHSKLCLSRLLSIHYAGMIHFSEHVKLVQLATLQVIVGSYGQNAYLEETIKSSQPKFYANASLSSTFLCCKHNIHVHVFR